MSDGFNRIARRDLDEALARATPALQRLDGGAIFLTGGTGFFGTWLVALLAHAREALGLRLELTLLTRRPEAFLRMAPGAVGQDFIRLHRGDVRSFEFPKGRFTHVVHAATDTSVAADRDAATLIDSIVGGTQRVLEFARAAEVRRLLYVSSGAVYGPQPTDLDRIPEAYPGACDPLDPRSAYGQAKRLAEQMCSCASVGGRLEPVIARAFAFVGPGLPLDGHFAIGNFIRDALAGGSIVVGGDGTPLRSYLYAGDLAAWLVTLLAQGEAGTAYNVGSDEAVSIADLAGLVARTLPSSTGVTIRGTATAGGHRSRYVPSIARAQSLGLAAWTPLDEAIRRTAAHAAEAPVPAVSSGTAHRNEHGGERQTFVIDVDGVVASLVPDNDYAKAEPLEGTIAAINRLHAAGHRIIMFTARGSATGIDWSTVTRDQFARWGLRYHELHFGKPAGDYYVDDRLISIAALQALG